MRKRRIIKAWHTRKLRKALRLIERLVVDLSWEWSYLKRKGRPSGTPSFWRDRIDDLVYELEYLDRHYETVIAKRSSGN